MSLGNNNGHSQASFSFESKCDVILEKLDYQDKEIAEIKESMKTVTNLVADPEKGLYGRVKTLESWKSGYSKFLWILISGIVGLLFSSVLWFKLFQK